MSCLRKPFWKYIFFPLVVNMALVGHLMVRDPGWWGVKALFDRIGCMAGRQTAVLQGLQART